MEVLNKEKVLEHAKELIKDGKIDRAITEYRRLLDVDPKDMRIKLRIAELLARQKKVSEAVKAYQEVADTYSADGFYLKAVTVYKNVLRLNPSLIDINYRLAELYEKMGLFKDSIHQYQILANSLEQKGDYQALIDVRKKIVGLDPHNVANRIRLAETYQYQGMEDESISEYEGLVGEVREAGKSDQLIELYEKILSYRPDNLEMIRALSNIYYKRGEWKKVVSHLEKSDKISGRETDLLLMQADVYTRLNQIETAKGKYLAAAEIFIEGGDIDQALDAYKEVLVISPDEEEKIRELVGGVDPDFFEKVKRDADEKRRRLEERAQEQMKEAEDTGDVVGVAPTGGHRGAPPIFSDEEVKARLRDADAAFELGKAYRQMGLATEAAPELEKGLNIYEALEAGGVKGDPVLSRIATIRNWLGIEGRKEVRPDEEETLDLRPRTPDIGIEKQEKTDVKEKVKDKKEIKKKKDKRVGFV